MDVCYRPASISELTRECEVRFRYLPGDQVNDVIGWVDRITGRHIHVGNESHLETHGLEIYHAKKYETKKIECLELRVSSLKKSE
jgi:hypothetical protein